MSDPATEKQIHYALYLARRAGLSLGHVDNGWTGISHQRWRGKGYNAAMVFSHHSKAEVSVIIDVLRRRAAAA